MNDHLCKKCGQAMQWVGSIASGALECTECKEAETLGESIEMARLKAEELEFQDLLAIDTNIKRLNRALAEVAGAQPPMHKRWVSK